ncbi:MAG: aspartate/glutamate racemase family protein [Proteobacteria bacterium]|nr:aspartate/glutamate racemase family protein [Pseudomonadota bacterium]
MMKKIGIVGGIAWPSTVEYYAGLCRWSQARHRAHGGTTVAPMPRISIESLDLAEVLACIGGDDDASWSAFDALHRDALLRLQEGGADFAVIASNTPHHRFAQITRGVRMPVLGMPDVAAAACRVRGARRVLILGTATTMGSGAFRAAFARQGIDAVFPRRAADRKRIVAIIDALQREKTASAAARIAAIVTRALPHSPDTNSAVYLGCTELPLAFPDFRSLPQFDFRGVHYLNSTALHIRAAFDHAATDSACTPRDGQARS